MENALAQLKAEEEKSEESGGEKSQPKDEATPLRRKLVLSRRKLNQLTLLDNKIPVSGRLSLRIPQQFLRTAIFDFRCGISSGTQARTGRS